MCRLLADGAGVAEDAPAADGTTVEDIGRELMNISDFERGRIGGNPIQQQISQSWEIKISSDNGDGE